MAYVLQIRKNSCWKESGCWVFYIEIHTRFHSFAYGFDAYLVLFSYNNNFCDFRHFACASFRFEGKAKINFLISTIQSFIRWHTQPGHEACTKTELWIIFQLISWPCVMAGMATAQYEKWKHEICASGSVFLEMVIQWTPIRSASDHKKLFIHYIHDTSMPWVSDSIHNHIWTVNLLENIFGFRTFRKQQNRWKVYRIH